MSKKNTWHELFESFKSRYPTLSKSAVDYRPYGYLTILVYLSDGVKIKYNDEIKQAQFITD